MKKLLSILSILTLTASVPAPLLANTVQTRVKRDVSTLLSNSNKPTSPNNVKIKTIAGLNENTGEVTSLTVDKNNNIYAGTFNGKLFKSTNNGASFSPVAGDWTTSKDVKVQAVDGSTKLLSFTTKTISVQQKDQPTSTPVPSDKGVKSFWKILGIVVGCAVGAGLVGMLLWRYWLRPWRTKIRNARSDKKAVERRAQLAKEEAEAKAEQHQQESEEKNDDGDNS